MTRQVNPNSINPFTPLPNGLIGKVEGYEWGVVFALRYYGLESYPSHKRIGEIAGISTRSVKRALESLREKGVVSWETRYGADGQQTSNLYELHLDGEWHNPPGLIDPPPGPRGLPPRPISPTPQAPEAYYQDLEDQDLEDQEEREQIQKPQEKAHPYPLPPELATLEVEIRTFWTKHKSPVSQKTSQAWKLQVTHLMKIFNDPEGGLDAVKHQLEKAAESSIIGKRWQSIKYDNWKAYGLKRKVNSDSRGYTPTSRPGLPIQKLTIDQIRGRQ